MTFARNKGLVVMGVFLFLFISVERSITIGTDTRNPEETVVNLTPRNPMTTTLPITTTIPTPAIPTLVPGYTIVINTFRRNSCVKQAIKHWLTCNPTQIRVVWPDPKNDVPDFAKDYDPKKVVFDEYPGSNMSYRFHPAPFITEAVFSVDDDCSYSCSAMAAAFKLYSDSNTPETEMVGFAPRKVHPDGGYWQAEAFHMLVYNTLFVTKGAFLHKRWFEIYWRDEHAQMRWLVDKNITAEDLLFSSIFAKEARKSPTAMQIKYKDRFTYGCGDGSSLAYAKGVLSPNQRRKLLVNYFFADLGHCPKLHCKCDRTLGDSSSYCLCNDVDKPTVIYDKHTPVTRCGYPFGFADNTLAFNVTSNQMEKLTKNADFI